MSDENDHEHDAKWLAVQIVDFCHGTGLGIETIGQALYFALAAEVLRTDDPERLAEAIGEDLRGHIRVAIERGRGSHN